MEDYISKGAKQVDALTPNACWALIFRTLVLFSGVQHQRIPETRTRPPKKARRAGWASLVLWSLIIFAGRMIAYNWFDCDRQPQPDLINWAAGCLVDGY